MTTASNAKDVPFRYNRFLHVLCILFLMAWFASSIRPVMPVDWWVENMLVFLFVGVLIVMYRWVPLSQLSYLLIFAYLCLHEWGAHYKYAIDPVGEAIRHVFHTVRNDFDRVVHFGYGLLMSYPLREVLLRKSGIRRGWSLWLPVMMILGFSAAYEIIEAAAAAVLSPDAGDAFLALQGDPWDTQKDMFMAFAGSVAAMGITTAFQRPQPKPAAAARERAVAVVR